MRRTPPTGIKRVAVAFLVGAVISSCASSSVDVVADGASSTTDTTEATVTTTDTSVSSVESGPIAAAQPPVDLAASAADFDFWAWGTSAVSEVEYYESINEMAEAATAVIVGRVIADVDPRVLITDTPEDVFSITRLEVQVEYLVAGDLPIGGPTILLEPQLAGQSGELPPGPALLFLRYKGENQQPNDTSAVARGDREAYRLVSSQGVLIEVDGRTINPSADYERRSDPVNTDAGGRPLTEVIAALTSG